jgi:hypothetical protein
MGLCYLYLTGIPEVKQFHVSKTNPPDESLVGFPNFGGLFELMLTANASSSI